MEVEMVEEETKKKQWLKEIKKQFVISVPMIFINLSFYLIPLISVMFAGHLGELQFAAANLANSWYTVTGIAFMDAEAILEELAPTPLKLLGVGLVGLSGALETLCGQGYGAQLYQSMGIYLQSSCIISLSFSTIISIVWWFTEPILVLLHQSESIAKEVVIFIKFLIPGLFAYGLIQNILRFLQTQYVLVVPLACSIIPLALHIGIAYAFVNLTRLGFRGAPLAASISLWISLVMLVVYVKFAKRFQLTFTGLSSQSFGQVFPILKLALPSAAMVCLEYWAFEILVLLAGIMPNPETTTSLVAMCVNTEAISYMVTYGLSAAASTRVSNELGAGNPVKARQAMWVTLKLSVSSALIIVLCLVLGHSRWAGLFSNSPNIITRFASMVPLLVVSITLDSLQGVISGVSRGCGWQQLAMYANLATYYFIGMPIAVLAAFKFKLYAKGLWIGLICGLSCQVALLEWLS